MADELVEKHLRLPSTCLIDLMKIEEDIPGIEGIVGAIEWSVDQNKKLQEENNELKGYLKQQAKIEAMARQIGRIEEELGGIYFHHHWQYCSPGARPDLVDSANNFVNQKIKNSQEKKASKAVKDRPQKPKQHQNIVDFGLQEDD